MGGIITSILVGLGALLWGLVRLVAWIISFVPKLIINLIMKGRENG